MVRVFAIPYDTGTDYLDQIVSHSVIFRQQEELRVTCSVGVVMVEKDDTEKTLLNRVDKVMYLGKKSGGNCVFSAEALEINK